MEQEAAGISSTEVRYQIGDNGTIPPTGDWLTNIPAADLGDFLWTHNRIIYTDESYTDSYIVAIPGTGISSTEVAYQTSESGTVIPDGYWATTIPTIPAGQWLWTRTTIYISNTTETLTTVSYSVSRNGMPDPALPLDITGVWTVPTPDLP